MFKKIHSDRDPQATVFSELKKEFAVYFAAAGGYAKRFTVRYPRFLFGLMVGLMLISLVLSFTIFRVKDSAALAKGPSVKQVSPISNGFDQIMQTGIALQKTIYLKKQVDSLTSKKGLTKADSAMLETDLDSLQKLNSPNKKKR